MYSEHIHSPILLLNSSQIYLPPSHHSQPFVSFLITPPSPPYVCIDSQECMATHWSMINLPGTTPLWETKPPSFRDYQLVLTPARCRGLGLRLWSSICSLVSVLLIFCCLMKVECMTLVFQLVGCSILARCDHG